MDSNQSRRLPYVLALAVLLPCTALAEPDSAVPWAPDLETARRVARQMNHLVLLHFWSTDCAPCRRLDDTVFTDREFAHRLAAHFVPVKINVTKNPSLVYQYGVRQWPTDVLTTPDGRVVHKMVSPQDPAQYLAILERVGSSAKSASGPPAAMDAGPQEAGLASYGAQPQRQAYEAPARYEAPATSRYSAAASHSSQHGETARFEPPPSRNQSTRSPYDDVYDRYTRDYVTQSHNAARQQPAAEPSDLRSSDNAWQGPTEIQNQFALRPGNPDARQTASPYGPPLRREGNSGMVSNTYATSGQAHSRQPTPQSALAQRNPASAIDPRNAAPAAAGGYRDDRRAAWASQTAPPSRPQAAGKAMDGYCPVTLIDKSKWVKGDLRYGLEHRGRIYLFANEEAMRTFWANPDRFSPALSGADPVALFKEGHHIAGKRQHGLVYKDRVYLFGNEQTLNEFYRAPDRYAEQVRVATRAATAAERSRR